MSLRVLVAPLDWGLGHATRSIPIIKLLLKRGHTVHLAGAGLGFSLLRAEFPHLPAHDLPAANVTYHSGSMCWNMLTQLPKFRKVIRDEHLRTEQLVEQHELNLIFSDNRYGCWSSAAKSIIITHQLNIAVPFFMRMTRPALNVTVKKLVSKFDECWIPDFPDHRLSGDLSKSNLAIKKKFIGPLARFAPVGTVEKRYFILCMLSGPEPQRTRLEEIIVDQLKKIDQPCCLVRGTNNSTTVSNLKHTIIDLADSEMLRKLITESELVVSRSGYSTIMDLVQLGSRAAFVPTPGQTEQEYLAEKLDRERVAPFMNQKSLNLNALCEQAKNYSGFSEFSSGNDELTQAFDQIGL